MRFPSEPNETGRTERVHKALQEAARYESETVAPEDLVARSLARYGHDGSRWGQSRPMLVLFASACGLGLLVGTVFRLQGAHSEPGKQTLTVSTPAVRPEAKAFSSDSMALAPIDIRPALLPPIDTTKFLVSTGRLLHRHGGVRHGRHLQSHASLAQNSSVPNRTNGSDALWTTETVDREVVTQTLTQVWIAHADPETATITMTPALFQLTLQPDENADPTAAQVGATLIPVQFEQENTQP